MKKRIIAALTAGILAVTLLAGCGGGTSASSSSGAAPAAQADSQGSSLNLVL